MQHYIPTKRKPSWARQHLRFDEPLNDWERKARALRVRRERFLKQQRHLKG